jgi:hypothetical protein
MLIIPGHKGNANQNHTKISPHPLESLLSRTQTTNAVEKGTLIHCWWECKVWKTKWRLLKN